jgi:hypothetical protein
MPDGGSGGYEMRRGKPEAQEDLDSMFCGLILIHRP